MKDDRKSISVRVKYNKSWGWCVIRNINKEDVWIMILKWSLNQIYLKSKYNVRDKDEVRIEMNNDKWEIKK